jgi:hypothetical protein
MFGIGAQELIILGVLAAGLVVVVVIVVRNSFGSPNEPRDE